VIDVPLAVFLIVVIVATGCGLAIADRLPWSDAARRDGVPLATAAGLAPLLLGLATVVVLWTVPSRNHVVHVALVIGALTIGALFGVRSLRDQVAQLRARFSAPSIRQWICALLLLGFVVALVVDAMTTSLVQNDAQEYAMVGRILYDSGDLRAYPVLDAQASPSGFYAPWTHPPFYVALAYMSYALQGDAADAHLFRLISPWCLIAAVLCVAAVGRRVSRETGLLAALICIATPMLYLGAASAQIDPLPVLGFAVAFAAFVSLEGSPARRGIACGLPLGLSLWTHSQAILYPALLLPLLLLTPTNRTLRERLPGAVQSGVIAVLVAVVIGSAPYLRNYLLFGVPISDNPTVFAYAPLGWDDFFKWQRGLAHVQEIVQYGVLKGFFAVEMFSVAFWLALLGLPLACVGLWARLKPDAARAEAIALCLPAALVVILVYFGGTVLSTLLGIDLMIRNERYLLVLMPCVSLLAASGVQQQSVVGAGFLRRVHSLLLIGLTVGLAAQLVALELYRQRIVRHYAGAEPSASVAEAGSGSEYLRRYTPQDAKVLAMRPADMFSAQRRMVSYLDPQLMPFYGERQPDPAFRALRQLGISYVQLPDYALPPIYNSQLMNILADPRYAELLYDRRGYQIYRLRDEPANATTEGATQVLHWQRRQLVKLGSLGGQLSLAEFDYAPGTTVPAWNRSLLLRRTTVTSLVSEGVPTESRCQSGRSPDEYRLAVAAAGEGFIQVLVDVKSADGSIERKSIGGVTLATDGATSSFVHRIRVLPDARSLSIVVEFRPIATVALRSAEVRALCQ
jgi:4-amino-4-deoxy-L-arabinose transferase-like glycosyltransferase